MTFSDQSIYHGSHGNYGGHWNEDTFQPSKQEYDHIGKKEYNNYSKVVGDKIDFSRFKNSKFISVNKIKINY